MTGPFNNKSAHSNAFCPPPTMDLGCYFSVSISPCSWQNKSAGESSLPVQSKIRLLNK